MLQNLSAKGFQESSFEYSGLRGTLDDKEQPLARVGGMRNGRSISCCSCGRGDVSRRASSPTGVTGEARADVTLTRSLWEQGSGFITW